MSDRERLLLADPVATKFLEEDASIRLLDRRQELSGYELYIVEQWACSRVNPTIVISTFTGQTQHRILASVLDVPAVEKEWPPRLRAYMRSTAQNHTRKQKTKLGNLMVTNLSTFPSTLTILPISSGDLRGHRELFFINENLKRMGCTGRAGLTLSQPSESAVNKFRQLYRTSEQIPVNEAVTELVQLCQIALTMFDKLPQDYCDGLLCDFTEKALTDWWTEIGLQYYNVEPTDGMLGPTTVAALLGLFLGARNRLHAWGAPVSKNAYDIYALKRGIAHFQKSRNLPKTRRLDRETLQRLHKHTAKAATHEGWGVPRAVKSTVAELGKGGEMVMGMVGAKEKAGIAEVETTDIETFVRKLNGERCKWVWRGKPRKTMIRGITQEHIPEDRPLRDESGGIIWEDSSSDGEDTSKPRLSNDGTQRIPTNESKVSLQSADRDQVARKTVLRTVAGRMNDAKSGLGRFRDAVGTGLRGHHHKASRDGNAQEPIAGSARNSFEDGERLDGKMSRKPTNKASIELIRGHSVDEEQETKYDDRDEASISSSPARSVGALSHTERGTGGEGQDELSPRDMKQLHLPAIRRARSLEPAQPSPSQIRARPNQDLRHISYTDLPALSQYFAAVSDVEDDHRNTPEAALRAEQYQYVQLEHLHNVLIRLKSQYPPVVADQLSSLQEVEGQAENLRHTIASAQRARLESSQAGAKLAEETVQEGKDMLTSRLQEIEAMGAKLEYELGVLQSKIEDVEDGVVDLDRQVLDLENRSRLLADESRDHSWHHWAETATRRLRIT